MPRLSRDQERQARTAVRTADARARNLQTQLERALAAFARAIAREEQTRLTGRLAKAATSDEARARLIELLQVFGLRMFSESADQAGRTVGNRAVVVRPSIFGDIIAGHESLVDEVEESIRLRMVDTIRDTIGAANQELPTPSTGTVARRIRENLREDITISQGRAERIARTETQGAANAGRREGLIVSGVKAQRWIAIRDGRGRHDHVHGQVQPITESFEFEGRTRKGGALVPTGQGTVRLRHPADPLGPANQVIQCRCTVVAHRVR